MLHLYPVHDLFLFIYFGCWQLVSHVRLWKLLYSVITTLSFLSTCESWLIDTSRS